MNMTSLTIGFAALACAANAPAQFLPAADRTALIALAAQNDAAWGEKDVAAIKQQYTADGSLRVAPGSPVVVGRHSILEFFGKAFARRNGVYRHITVIDHLEPITSNLVLADGGVRVERQEADGRWSLVRTFRNVSVVAREAGEWKLRSVRAIPQG